MSSYFLLPTSYFLLPSSFFLLPSSYFLLPSSFFLLPTSLFPLPPKDFEAYVATVYEKDLVRRARHVYPASNGYPTQSGYNGNYWSGDRIETDFAYQCAARRSSRQLTATRRRGGQHGGDLAEDLGRRGRRNHVYQYWFTHHTDQIDSAFVSHGLELPYVFQGLKPADAYTDKDRAMAKTMLRYWVQFATCGNPNRCRGHHQMLSVDIGDSGDGGDDDGGDGDSVGSDGDGGNNDEEGRYVDDSAKSSKARLRWWPRYHTRHPVTLRLDVPVERMVDLNATQCDFWDAHWSKFGRCVPPIVAPLGADLTP
jgi:hypothetical protein